MNTAIIFAAVLIGTISANLITSGVRTGPFTLSYRTDDGTVVSEEGVLKRNKEGNGNVLVKSGSFSFNSPEGVPFRVTYEADERGFRPQGAHLPVNVEPIAPVF